MWGEAQEIKEESEGKRLQKGKKRIIGGAINSKLRYETALSGKKKKTGGKKGGTQR